MCYILLLIFNRRQPALYLVEYTPSSRPITEVKQARAWILPSGYWIVPGRLTNWSSSIPWELDFPPKTKMGGVNVNSWLRAKRIEGNTPCRVLRNKTKDLLGKTVYFFYFLVIKWINNVRKGNTSIQDNKNNFNEIMYIVQCTRTKLYIILVTQAMVKYDVTEHRHQQTGSRNLKLQVRHKICCTLMSSW